MRIACIHIPQFALQCASRLDPALRGAPVVVVGGFDPMAGSEARASHLGLGRDRSGPLDTPVVMACSREAWALGVRGFHYWNVNYSQPGQDPYDDLSDSTPVNGDGLLVYPGPNGPIDSLRWELIRDGIEDYDYLALLLDRRNKLIAKGGQEALLAKAAQVYDLGALLPDLVNFTRDTTALEARRNAIEEMIEEMDRALGAKYKGRLSRQLA